VKKNFAKIKSKNENALRSHKKTLLCAIKIVAKKHCFFICYFSTYTDFFATFGFIG